MFVRVIVSSKRVAPRPTNLPVFTSIETSASV